MVDDLPNCLFAVYILQMQAIFDASLDELAKELEGVELPSEISFFEQWIKTLPQNTTYFPLFYNDEELAELDGSHIVDKRAEMKEYNKNEFDLMCNQIPELNSFTFEEYMEAKMIAVSSKIEVVIDRDM